MTRIIHGNILFSETREKLASYENNYLVVEDGTVEGIYSVLPERYTGLPVEDYGAGVIIPAFSDLHVHAPQYPQRGLGMDLLLEDWLNTYTFPLEAKYADLDYAKQVYDAFVDDLILHGTFHVVAFGTIHRKSDSYLLERMEKKGLSGYVGKVNMDFASPDYLSETVEESLRETEQFLADYSESCHMKPILTPRFAPTCTKELLEGLGKLGRKYGVGLQTHLVESKWEAARARELYPDCSCDTEIYEKAGLCGNGPVIGAHYIFPSEDDQRILKKYNGFAVHCPDATVNVIAGIMQTGKLLDNDLHLALGSDIAAGHCLGIYSQVARAVQLSKLKSFYEPQDNRTITFNEAFYMATKSSGQIFGKVGSFEKGYDFDALVIDGMADSFRELSPVEVIEKFCYFGGTANIKARYIRGEKVKNVRWVWTSCPVTNGNGKFNLRKTEQFKSK